jgi:hypothetical protein
LRVLRPAPTLAGRVQHTDNSMIEVLVLLRAGELPLLDAANQGSARDSE